MYGFTLIDGTGTKHVLSRDDPDPTLFLAAGVSAGLCGIITDVTLTLTPAFKVTGTQQTSPIQPLNPDWKLGCPVNLYGPATQGVPGVEEYFKDPNNEYMRMVYHISHISFNLILKHLSLALLAPTRPSASRPDLDRETHRSGYHEHTLPRTRHVRSSLHLLSRTMPIPLPLGFTSWVQ